jgi:uncharacterized protein (TIGR02271 family)
MDQNKTSSNGEPQRRHEQVIPVVHEHATVHKEIVETGKINIRKTVVEEAVQVNIPIINESYSIERVPVSNNVSDAPPPAVRYEGDVMIIPVVREITVVQKRYEVVEELRITKVVTESPLVQEITLLKEQVHIERTGNNHSNFQQ